MKIPQSTLVAKGLYKLSGLLTGIKTYANFYSIDMEVTADPEGMKDWELHTTYVGRRWGSWQFAYTVLNWSLKLDWEHWDHWALIHETCGWTPCTECKGRICGPFEDDE